MKNKATEQKEMQMNNVKVKSVVEQRVDFLQW